MKSKTSGYVIAHQVIPSGPMNDLIKSMVDQLEDVAKGTWTDFHPEDNNRHITILWKLYNKNQYGMAWKAFPHDASALGKLSDFIKIFLLSSSIKPIREDFHILRMAIRKNHTIVGEYDFPRRIWIPSNKMWDTNEWQKTWKAFR